MNTLYHYAHCPFCVRVRLACGFLNVTYKSVVLSYDDEKTPVELMGVKMLPIFQFEDGSVSNESLDIIERLDVLNRFNWPEQKQTENWSLLEVKLEKLGACIHNLVMPYWVFSHEFSQEARKYFIAKKSQKRGPFKDLMRDRYKIQEQLKPLLLEVESELSPFWKHSDFGIFDILLASHLWGLYVLPEFQFSEKLHTYLQEIKKRCKFEYHGDFFSEDTTISF